MKTSLFIDNDRFFAHHGVGEQERVVGNEFTVSLRLFADLRAAALSDDLADTISYAEVHELVRQEMEQPSRLLEHVAWRIAVGLFRAFPTAEAVQLRITKRNPPMGADVAGAGVELSLTRGEVVDER